MAMRYHFVTEMVLASSPEVVQATLENVTGWPAWWKWARRVEQLNDLPAGAVGARYRNDIRTPLLYGFSYVTEIVAIAPGRIQVSSSGDLQGSGLFAFETSSDGATALSFSWLVETTKWWMNIAGPLARPLFAWNHDRLMTDFAQGLARASRGDLRRVEHTAIAPSDSRFYRL
jgi:hypothetical protein